MRHVCYGIQYLPPVNHYQWTYLDISDQNKGINERNINHSIII